MLSDFVDGTLEPQERVLLSAHLHECLPCAGVRDDLKAIVGLCREHRDDYIEVPNQRALWLRISNVVESERTGLSWVGASKRQEGAGSVGGLSSPAGDGNSLCRRSQRRWRRL
ncbi:MAG: zf-HC2 domain-containing protein [Pyrinomonadaceae bacterium]